MATTTTTTNTSGSTSISDEQRAAINNRNNVLRGFLGGLPGANPDDPWGSGGSYFSRNFGATNPFGYNAGSGFTNPLLNDTVRFFSDEMGKIQTPKINYTATGNTYNPVDLSGADRALQTSTQGIFSGGSPVAKESVARTSSEAAIGAARDIMSQIITPGVRAQLVSSGMGRTGAEAEITSQRGAEIALPIAQQWQREQSSANELEANLGQQANNLTAQIGQQDRQLQVQIAQVQYLKQVEASLQAQALQARDQSEVRQINSQLAMVQAQLARDTQQISALLAGKGLDAGVQLATAGGQWDLNNRGQQNNLLLGLLNGTPIPGGESSNRSTSVDVDTPSNLPNQLLNLAALLGLSGGGALVQKALSAGVDSVGAFLKWIGVGNGNSPTVPGGFGPGTDPVTGLPDTDPNGFDLDPIDGGGWQDPFDGANPYGDPGGDLPSDWGDYL